MSLEGIYTHTWRLMTRMNGSFFPTSDWNREEKNQDTEETFQVKNFHKSERNLFYLQLDKKLEKLNNTKYENILTSIRYLWHQVRYEFHVRCPGPAHIYWDI
jgi:hypothetical protein